MIVYDKMICWVLRLASAAVCTSARRLFFAFSISVAIHVYIVWLPHIYLARDKIKLTPLEVHLERVPNLEILSETTNQAQHERMTEESVPGGKSPAKSAIDTSVMKKMKRMEPSAVTREFPKKMHLFFSVYKGKGAGRVGEALHQFELQDGSYTLHAIKHTKDLSRTPDATQVVRTSRGVIDEKGLHPRIYTEMNGASGGKQKLVLHFDWDAQTITLGGGAIVSLPDYAQDGLSYAYQFSQIPMQKEIVSLPVSNGVSLEKHEFEIGVAENIDTPIGQLHVLHLRKLHKKNEAYFELWLGLEYRLLPVKFRQINEAEEVVEEMVVSDIRVSDE